jgi:hypothetical protein
MWTKEAMGLLALFAVVLQVLLSLGPSAWVAARVLEAGWLSVTVARTSAAMNPFDPRAFGELPRVLRGPVPRWLAAAGVPLLVAAWLSTLGSRAVTWGSVGAWASALALVGILPPALVVAGLEGPGRAVAWPWALPEWIRRLGADLLPLHAFAAVAVGMEFVDGTLAPFSAGDMSLELSYVKAFIPRFLSVLSLAGLGCLAGHLLWTRASGLGHGPAEADRVPRVREAPSGTYVPPARDPAELEAERARRYAPIDLETEEAPAEGPVERAQRVAAQGDYAAAAALLWSVVAVPGATDGARALVILARLHVERLGEPRLGETLYRRVVAEHPGTSAAAYAQARLDEDG